jgi:hypothetical protein
MMSPERTPTHPVGDTTQALTRGGRFPPHEKRVPRPTENPNVPPTFILHA